MRLHHLAGPFIAFGLMGCPPKSVAHRPIVPTDGHGSLKCNSAIDCYEQALIALAAARADMDGLAQTLLDTAVPIGMVVAFAGDKGAIPQLGWLPCDGAEVDASIFPALAAFLGTRYGTPTKANSVVLPDYQGYFLRGWDPKHSRDKGARKAIDGAAPGAWEIGTVEADGVGPHHHNTSVSIGGSGGPAGTFGAANDVKPTIFASDAGDTIDETRPKNMRVVFLIRADLPGELGTRVKH